MSQPAQNPQSPPVGEGTDITVDPEQVEDVDASDTPATSDPEELTDDGALGGAGGTGGAG